MTAARTEKVFLGVPSYDDRVGAGIVNVPVFASRRQAVECMQIESGSWLTKNFNSLYARALNMRVERGITHFCLLHDDISVNDPWWLDRMLDLMAEHHADVLSVVVPIKNGSGITSTALDEVVGPDRHIRRLTLHEVFNQFPATFTHEKLLLNTGVMLVDVRRTWADLAWFDFMDKIVREDSGVFRAVGLPEDWGFSRKAAALGARLFATREIKVTHHGRGAFGNHGPWGALKTDQ